jgi:hypothetical protein
LPWQRRREATALLAALKRPDRGFDQVVIGEPHPAFYGNQFGLTFPLFIHYGVRLWVPEVGGALDPDNEAHDQVMLGPGRPMGPCRRGFEPPPVAPVRIARVHVVGSSHVDAVDGNGHAVVAIWQFAGPRVDAHGRRCDDTFACFNICAIDDDPPQRGQLPVIMATLRRVSAASAADQSAQSRAWRRAVAFAAVLLVTAPGLAGCTAKDPIGLRKDGGTVTAVIGRQCAPERYLTKLRVANYDRTKKAEVAPVLWEIGATRPQAMHSVRLGTVPDGYVELANNLATQAIGDTVWLSVTIGDTYGSLFDKENLKDGKVLDAALEVKSEEEFHKQYGC